MHDHRTPSHRVEQPLRPGLRVEAATPDQPARRGTVVEVGARVVWDDEDAPVYVPARDLRPVGGR